MDNSFDDDLADLIRQLDRTLEPQRPAEIREAFLLIKEALDVLESRTHYLICLSNE